MSEQSKKESAFELFEKSEVLKNLNPKFKLRWLDRIDVNSEIPIESQIQYLENELSAFNHTSANNQNYSGFPPKQTFNQQSIDKEIIDEIIDNMIGFTK